MQQQTYTVNEYREEPEDKKKRKKKKKDSLEGGLQVDLKGPSVELGRIYSFINRFFKKKNFTRCGKNPDSGVEMNETSIVMVIDVNFVL